MIAPLVSAILLALGTMTPYGLPLTLIALVPLLKALRRPPERWSGWRLGYLFGFFYGLAQLAFIFILTARWTESPGLALVPYLVATALFALYFGLFGWLARRLFVLERAWAIPLLWAGIEVFRSYIPVFAFPWGLLATPWHVLPEAMRPAANGSIYLVSAILAGFNFAVVLGTERAMMAVVGVMAIASVRFPQESSRSVDVAVVQPGVDMAFGDPQAVNARLVSSIDRLLRAVGPVDLVVLPEGLARGGSSLPPAMPFSLPRSPSLFGGQRGSGPYFQSAFAWDGRVWRVVDKTRLVIFGEFVPGRDFLPFLQAFKLPSGDLTAGRDGVRSLPYAFGKVGPVICFEALFPDIAARQNANGSRLLAVMSIDDWFMGTSAPEQLRAAAAWRAIENGLPVVRAATLGTTELVGSDGRVVDTVASGVPRVLLAKVPLPDRGNPAWKLAIFPLLAVLASLLTPWLPRRVRHSSGTPESDPTREPYAPL